MCGVSASERGDLLTSQFLVPVTRRDSFLQGEVMELHFMIGQCTAGTRLMNTLDSLSGSGALIMTDSDSDSTIAIDLFPCCIGEPILLLH